MTAFLQRILLLFQTLGKNLAKTVWFF